MEICSAEDFYQTLPELQPKIFNIPIDENRPFKMEGISISCNLYLQKNSNAEDVLIEMLNAYRNTGGNVTDTELIVASIVQMETRNPDHMSIIAGIIYNRLEQGMPLQSSDSYQRIH